jgi:hypothetical protein
VEGKPSNGKIPMVTWLKGSGVCFTLFPAFSVVWFAQLPVMLLHKILSMLIDDRMVEVSVVESDKRLGQPAEEREGLMQYLINRRCCASVRSEKPSAMSRYFRCLTVLGIFMSRGNVHEAVG